MTRAEQLRAAASAERLADWVRIDGFVWAKLRDGTHLFVLGTDFVSGETSCYASGEEIAHGSDLDQAIRAGLLALADREEASQ